MELHRPPSSSTNTLTTHFGVPAAQVFTTTTIGQKRAQALSSVLEQGSFDEAYRRWVSTRRRDAWVHVAFSSDADIPARFRSIVSSLLLAMITDRSLTVSWVPLPLDSGFQHDALISLFQAPGFDWWYSPDKFGPDRLESLEPFGLDSPTANATLPDYFAPRGLLCPKHSPDIFDRRGGPRFLEVHWKFDFFAPALAVNPLTSSRMAALGPPDAVYAQAFQRLFAPTPLLWNPISDYMQRRLAVSSPHVIRVGIELVKKRDVRSAVHCLDQLGIMAFLDPASRRYRKLSAHDRLKQLAPGLRSLIGGESGELAPDLAAAVEVRVVIYQMELNHGWADELRDRVNGSASSVFELGNLDDAFDLVGSSSERYSHQYASEKVQIAAHYVLGQTDVVLVPETSSSARYLGMPTTPFLVTPDSCHALGHLDRPCWPWTVNQSTHPCPGLNYGDVEKATSPLPCAPVARYTTIRG